MSVPRLIVTIATIATTERRGTLFQLERFLTFLNDRHWVSRFGLRSSEIL
jgi:hypothetical protein